MNITLVGFMGTGKTAVGRKLAKRLAWEFIDADERIAERAGMPVAKIFATRGEAVFRRLERRCIARVVHGQNQIVATGGGAFLDQESRGLLRASGPVICLTATPKALLARLGRQITTRPLLHGMGSPLARIQELLAQRASSYAQADLTIETSALTVDQVVNKIWEHLSPLLCRSWQYVRDHMEDLGKRYGGKYVVVVSDRIVASGSTQLEAYQSAASQIKTHPDAGIYYIPLPEESLTAL
jgi:shikimate kinase